MQTEPHQTEAGWILQFLEAAAEFCSISARESDSPTPFDAIRHPWTYRDRFPGHRGFVESSQLVSHFVPGIVDSDRRDDVAFARQVLAVVPDLLLADTRRLRVNFRGAKDHAMLESFFDTLLTPIFHGAWAGRRAASSPVLIGDCGFGV
jgi:hypothetical protein